MSKEAQKIRYMAFVDELKKLAMIPGIPSSDKGLSDKAKAGIDAARMAAGKNPIHGSGKEGFKPPKAGKMKPPKPGKPSESGSVKAKKMKLPERPHSGLKKNPLAGLGLMR